MYSASIRGLFAPGAPGREVLSVSGGAGGAFGGEDALAFGGGGAGVQKAFPDDLDGGRSRMDEVVGVESVVS